WLTDRQLYSHQSRSRVLVPLYHLFHSNNCSIIPLSSSSFLSLSSPSGKCVVQWVCGSFPFSKFMTRLEGQYGVARSPVSGSLGVPTTSAGALPFCSRPSSWSTPTTDAQMSC